MNSTVLHLKRISLIANINTTSIELFTQSAINWKFIGIRNILFVSLFLCDFPISLNARQRFLTKEKRQKNIFLS